jgi:hypothetical protein
MFQNIALTKLEKTFLYIRNTYRVLGRFFDISRSLY